MREPAVFYCPKCGHYAYYQTSRHPQCPKYSTQEAVCMARMHYTRFVRMFCDKRDEFLFREILETNPSLITRLTEPHRRYNSREVIAEMNNVVMNLDIENKILSDMVKWVHDIIWELMHEKRESDRDRIPACRVCRGQQPSEKSMEETMKTEQTETAYSEATVADISRAIAPEKGQEEQLAANSKKPNLKNTQISNLIYLLRKQCVIIVHIRDVLCAFIFLRLERSGAVSHKIITIARQLGNGGHEATQRLSEQLGIPLYDRNLVEMTAQRMGRSPVSVEKTDESALSSLLAVYQIPKEPNSVTGYGLSLDDSIYVTQTIIIEALAQKGPCIIVGRCGDYVFHSYPDLIGVFIYADVKDRVRRVMDRYSFSERDAVSAIKSTDRQRKDYYENCTKRKWDSIECHQMLLNISKLGIDKTVRIIEGIYEIL